MEGAAEEELVSARGQPPSLAGSRVRGGPSFLSALPGVLLPGPLLGMEAFVQAWVHGCGGVWPGFIFFSSQLEHPPCWLNEGTFFAFGGEDRVASASSSLLGQFLVPGQWEPWGSRDRTEQ